MPQVKLKENEHFLICVLRYFDFLRNEGYDYGSFVLYFREVTFVFENQKIKRQLSVCWSDRHTLDIEIRNLKLGIINRRKSSFLLADLYPKYRKNFLKEPISQQNYEELVRRNAQFVKENLMEIITGNEWI